MEGKVIEGVLSNDADVSAVATDIYASMAPENASLPYVVYNRITGIEDKTKLVEPTKASRFQIDSYASSKTVAEDLMSKCETALKGYSGSDYGPAVVIIQHESDNPDDINQKSKVHKSSRDYSVKVKP